MTGRVVPGTVSCWRVKDDAEQAPFLAACACGWYLLGRPSQRAAKRSWHFHLQRVRAGRPQKDAA